jgi:hypothetical protein
MNRRPRLRGFQTRKIRHVGQYQGPPSTAHYTYHTSGEEDLQEDHGFATEEVLL